MSYYNDYEGYESPDEEWDRLQKELQDEIVDRIENTISKKIGKKALYAMMHLLELQFIDMVVIIL